MPEKNELRTVEIPACTLPVVAEADVIVAGGGTTGFIAAVAAARTGAKTILVERYGYLGGSLTGTYATNPSALGDSYGNRIIGGLCWEFIERMEATGAAIVDRKNWSAQIFPEATKAVALEMVAEAGVDLYLHTWVSQVLMENNVIKGIIIESKSGREVMEAKTYIDATGDADIAFMAGAPTEKAGPDELWQTSVDLVICNVDSAKVIRWAYENSQLTGVKELPEDIDQLGIHEMFTLRLPNIRDDKASADSKGPHIGPMPTVKLMIHPSISRVQGSVEIDGTDVKSLTHAEIEARRKAMEHLEYLKKNVPGHENAIVIGESHLGVRETRRIVGDYRLTIDDLRKSSRFHDIVALNARALDRHLKGEVFEYIPLKGNHDIPLRALIPYGVKNLLVAGRCISSDHESNASLRGAATCMATGHAAGTSAAFAARSSGMIRETNVREIQGILREQKAILMAD